MTTITFDTHEFVKKLRDVGFTEPQAEALAVAQKESLSQSLETSFATKADIARLEGKIDTLELRLTIKMGVLIAGSAAIFGAIVKLL